MKGWHFNKRKRERDKTKLHESTLKQENWLLFKVPFKRKFVLTDLVII